MPLSYRSPLVLTFLCGEWHRKNDSCQIPSYSFCVDRVFSCSSPPMRAYVTTAVTWHQFANRYRAAHYRPQCRDASLVFTDSIRLGIYLLFYYPGHRNGIALNPAKYKLLKHRFGITALTPTVCLIGIFPPALHCGSSWPLIQHLSAIDFCLLALTPDAIMGKQRRPAKILRHFIILPVINLVRLIGPILVRHLFTWIPSPAETSAAPGLGWPAHSSRAFIITTILYCNLNHAQPLWRCVVNW